MVYLKVVVFFARKPLPFAEAILEVKQKITLYWNMEVVEQTSGNFDENARRKNIGSSDSPILRASSKQPKLILHL